MSYEFDSKLGEQLYRLLPEVYRTRDKTVGEIGGGSGTEDLAKYLDAHGHLLDLIHETLRQQLKDTLPGSSQDWLLPYFAQLLAANIVSPDSEGKHAEISNAVSWRQRKGTLKCVEEIAEAVGQMEVELQEGWKRVAMTPRIGMPIILVKGLEDRLKLNMSNPSEAIRHPSLPAAMVDLRWASRAVKALPTNPAARLSSFSGVKEYWRQVNLHGVPCFKDSFDDLSRRTVDLRTPGAKKGHYHHKRLLAYTPPPSGLFPFDPLIRTWDEAIEENLIEVKDEGDVLVFLNRTDRIIEITDKVDLVKSANEANSDARSYRIERVNFHKPLKVPRGGTLALIGVKAAKKVSVNTFSTDEVVLSAVDCLFGELSSAGRVSLDSCTVLSTAYLSVIEAIDCIFMDIKGTDITGVIEYSRIPEHAPLSSDKNRMVIKSHHLKPESTYGYDLVIDDPSFITKKASIDACCAVLSPRAPRSIYEGASDLGEMGYFHHGRKGRPVRIAGDFTEDKKLKVPIDGGYPLEDIIFVGSVEVTGGTFELVRSAVNSLKVITPLKDDDKKNVIPFLDARDCLFDNLTVLSGLARLEYCTVMKTADCRHLQASDSIFAGSIINVKPQDTLMQPPSFFNCMRYSSIPAIAAIPVDPDISVDLSRKIAKLFRVMDKNNKITLGSNTFERPVFIQFDYCVGDVHEGRKAKFGESGYGVLDPITFDAIRFGAEDGGEMGTYHHKYYSLKAEAVLDKMREFLPVGIEPVLIQDTHLLRAVPESKKLSNGGGS